MKQLVDRFIQFLDNSPTSYHAAENIAARLDGFTELSETAAWKIERGRSYFVRRFGSIIAFNVPAKKIDHATIFAAHTDSPALKLKPQGEFSVEGTKLLHFEIYGAPILASWIGRELYLAGRLFYENSKNELVQKLVSYKEHPIFIPNLALHLDRQVNEQGLQVNKQDHLSAMTSISDASYLQKLLSKTKNVVHAELFAVPLQKAELVGLNYEWLTSYRLDNLASVASCLEAFLQVKPSTCLSMISFFDHEEIGSETYAGAQSSFFNDTFSRICISLQMDREEEFCFKARSKTISCDVAHACHPNHLDKHDSRHRLQLGKGIVIKTNAQERYASPFDLTAYLMQRWKKNKIAYQFFSARNDIPSGITLGSMHAAKSNFNTIDIGIPVLGMHSVREMLAVKDYVESIEALKALIN